MLLDSQTKYENRQNSLLAFIYSVTDGGEEVHWITCGIKAFPCQPETAFANWTKPGVQKQKEQKNPNIKTKWYSIYATRPKLVRAEVVLCRHYGLITVDGTCVVLLLLYVFTQILYHVSFSFFFFYLLDDSWDDD